MQLAVDVRDAMLNAIETTIGTSPIMKIFVGAVPANCAAADSGAVLATLSLPSDWMAASSGGTKIKSGTWEDVSADATGTAGHVRIYTSGNVCKLQGNITATGDGGFMTVNNVSFATTQPFVVTAFSLTMPHA